MYYRPVGAWGAEGAEGAFAPPDFGRSVKAIPISRGRYAHHITTGTPGFSDLPTALYYMPVGVHY